MTPLALDFDALSFVFEWIDGLLTPGLDDASFLVAILIALLLGLRHASDPDHLVAVTSLVVSEEGGVGDAGRLGAWWGAGHALTLVAAGIPLIAFAAHIPRWLEQGAERLIGVVIIILAARVLIRSLPSRRPKHGQTHVRVRTRRQAFAIGTLHGLAGTGAVVLLLMTALDDQLQAAAALAVFAPMSMVSMAACSSAFAWVLKRETLRSAVPTVVTPLLGVFGLMFGVWYTGLLG